MSILDDLKAKLAERMNWDTFKKEIGQGMDVSPQPMMVLTPATIGKFIVQLANNQEYAKTAFKEFPTPIRKALAFFKTRYPTSFNKIFAFDKEISPELAGTYNNYLKRISINPSSGVHPSVRPTVETIGHEVGHNIVSRRWPKIFSNPEIDSLYNTRDAIEETWGPGTKLSPFKEELAARLKMAMDTIYSNPAEIIPDKFGKAATKSLDKYYNVSFPK